MSAAAFTTVSAEGWGVGARLGSGLQAVGQRNFYNGNYAELRVGMDWMHPDVVADISLLYNWNVADMDWTMRGDWFFDAGVGLNLSGKRYFTAFGVQGVAKLGYAFEDSPMSLSLDWSPTFGPGWVHVGGVSDSSFNDAAIWNFGVSAIYNF